MTPRIPQTSTANGRPPRVVLVLGGGGVRGSAHLGVVRAVDRLRLPVAETVTTGLGALVAAAWIAGVDAATAACRLGELIGDGLAWPKDATSPAAATARLREHVARALPVAGFEALPRPLSCTALGLRAGVVRTFGLAGASPLPIAEAVTASCLMPGRHAPLAIGDDLWVDAGWIDPLPLEVAQARRPELIVAVDLAGHGHDRGGDADTPEAVLSRTLECAAAMAGAERLHRMHGRSELVVVRPRIGDVSPWGTAEPQELAGRGEWDTLLALSSDPRTRWLCDPEVVKALDRAGDAPADHVRLDVDATACIHCGICAAVCPTAGYAAVPHGDVVRKLHHYECMRDAACMRACPTGAIRLEL